LTIPAIPDMNSLRAKLMERKRKLNAVMSKESIKVVANETLDTLTPSFVANKALHDSNDNDITQQTSEAKPNKKLTSETPSDRDQALLVDKKKTEITNIQKPALTSGKIKTSSVFGSSSMPTFGRKSGATTTKNVNAFGAFLDLKPPGSSLSSTNLTFGSSTSITLPMPSKSSTSAPQMSFGIFGSTSTLSKTPAFGSIATSLKSPAFGSGAISSNLLFGNSSKKRSSSPGEEIHASKQARMEDGEVDSESEEVKSTDENRTTKDNSL